jgi:hypothetical protein
MSYLFVDESGDTGVKSNRLLVFGFVHCINPELLRNVLRFQLKRLHENDLYPKKLHELKFTLPRNRLLKDYSEHELGSYENNMPSIRESMAELINSLTEGVFASAIDKSTVREPTWTSEYLCNYIFRRTISDHIIGHVTNPIIFFDKGRLDNIKEQDFRRYLISQFNGASANSVHSHKEPCIWAADYVAGAYYQSLSFGNEYWFNLISRKIGTGNYIYWEK